jgi:hypothetical protein
MTEKRKGWGRKDAPPATPYVLDGVMRSQDVEHQLNQQFREVFRTPAGQAVLGYLKSMTINLVSGPGVGPDHLMHLEGQRFAIAMIERRYNDGLNGVPSLDEKTS